jgi:LPXTG-site transpeptidase (sortase) family protein
MRDFSFLLVSFTALVLGALIMFDAYKPHELIELGAIEDVEPGPDLPPLPTPQATAAPEPQAPRPSEATVTRLRIPKIGVDANIVYLGVDAQGYMEAPKEPFDVAYYDFSSHPGHGSNAVFAGHVDSAKVGPAIFWRLRQVAEGDQIQVALADGTIYDYKVIYASSFTSDAAPVQDIIGPTAKDSITVITCDGTFNTRTHEYDRRLIVRAERI